MVGYYLTAARTKLREITVEGGDAAWIDGVREFEVLHPKIREAEVCIVDDSVRPPALCV